MAKSPRLAPALAVAALFLAPGPQNSSQSSSLENIVQNSQTSSTNDPQPRTISTLKKALEGYADRYPDGEPKDRHEVYWAGDIKDLEGKPIIVKQSAWWCGPCILSQPVFEALGESLNLHNIGVATIDVDEYDFTEEREPLPHYFIFNEKKELLKKVDLGEITSKIPQFFPDIKGHPLEDPHPFYLNLGNPKDPIPEATIGFIPGYPREDIAVLRALKLIQTGEDMTIVFGPIPGTIESGYRVSLNDLRDPDQLYFLMNHGQLAPNGQLTGRRALDQIRIDTLVRGVTKLEEENINLDKSGLYTVIDLLREPHVRSEVEDDIGFDLDEIDRTRILIETRTRSDISGLMDLNVAHSTVDPRILEQRRKATEYYKGAFIEPSVPQEARSIVERYEGISPGQLLPRTFPAFRPGELNGILNGIEVTGDVSMDYHRRILLQTNTRLLELENKMSQSRVQYGGTPDRSGKSVDVATVGGSTLGELENVIDFTFYTQNKIGDQTISYRIVEVPREFSQVFYPRQVMQSTGFEDILGFANENGTLILYDGQKRVAAATPIVGLEGYFEWVPEYIKNSIYDTQLKGGEEK